MHPMKQFRKDTKYRGEKSNEIIVKLGWKLI